jgi:hypothetical protein
MTSVATQAPALSATQTITNAIAALKAKIASLESQLEKAAFVDQLISGVQVTFKSARSETTGVGRITAVKTDENGKDARYVVRVNENTADEETQVDNMQDTVQRSRGNHARGARHGRAKLTDNQVKEIRMRAASGGVGTKAALSREFGVSDSQISHICNGKVWNGA